MITHTISVAEIIWTLFCSIGLIYNTRILIRALKDLHRVRVRKINSLREYSARLTVFVYSMLSFVQFVFVAVGVIFMTVPSQPSVQPINPTQIIVTVSFIIVSAILGVGAYINEFGRRKLLEKIRELEEF